MNWPVCVLVVVMRKWNLGRMQQRINLYLSFGRTSGFNSPASHLQNTNIRPVVGRRKQLKQLTIIRGSCQDKKPQSIF
jgi:hypothetical protein